MLNDGEGACGPTKENAMQECKFKKTETKHGCEGGHTTAQHYTNVYERVIKQECGIAQYYCIKEAVDRDAKAYLVMLAFVGVIIAKTNCDYETAKRRIAELCAITETQLGL